MRLIRDRAPKRPTFAAIAILALIVSILEPRAAPADEGNRKYDDLGREWSEWYDVDAICEEGWDLADDEPDRTRSRFRQTVMVSCIYGFVISMHFLCDDTAGNLVEFDPTYERYRCLISVARPAPPDPEPIPVPGPLPIIPEREPILVPSLPDLKPIEDVQAKGPQNPVCGRVPASPPPPSSVSLTGSPLFGLRFCVGGGKAFTEARNADDDDQFYLEVEYAEEQSQTNSDGRFRTDGGLREDIRMNIVDGFPEVFRSETFPASEFVNNDGSDTRLFGATGGLLATLDIENTPNPLEISMRPPGRRAVTQPGANSDGYRFWQRTGGGNPWRSGIGVDRPVANGP